jgi:methylated-DNA-[protein]-cysteine S-methyltransferase
MRTTVERVIASPLGPLTLVATDEALTGVQFNERTGPGTPGDTSPPAHPVLDLAARQLEEYFAGERKAFSIPLAVEGTPFQRAVWSRLEQIPFGEQRSYAWLASAVGDSNACRAVGAANGRNPLAIVVPCHRVVGGDGSLTGYAGGLDRKRWLLAHEQQGFALR